MGERVENYTFTDEEGCDVKFNYITRWCMCCMSCEDDEIELFEDGAEIPYRLKVGGVDMKWFIQSLIDGSIKPKLTNNKE